MALAVHRHNCCTMSSISSMSSQMLASVSQPLAQIERTSPFFQSSLFPRCRRLKSPSADRHGNQEHRAAGSEGKRHGEKARTNTARKLTHRRCVLRVADRAKQTRSRAKSRSRRRSKARSTSTEEQRTKQHDIIEARQRSKAHTARRRSKARRHKSQARRHKSQARRHMLVAICEKLFSLPFRRSRRRRGAPATALLFALRRLYSPPMGARCPLRSRPARSPPQAPRAQGVRRTGPARGSERCGRLAATPGDAPVASTPPRRREPGR